MRRSHCYFLKAFTAKFFERVLIMLTLQLYSNPENVREPAIVFNSLENLQFTPGADK